MDSRNVIRRLLESQEDVDPELQIQNGFATVYHATSSEAAKEIQRSKRLLSPHEPDVYVTTRMPEYTAYGDGTVIAFEIPLRWLKIEDEYPSGRQDYRYHFRTMDAARRGVPIRNPRIVATAED